MFITYKSRKLEKVCTNAQYVEIEMAFKIQQHIGEISVADSVDMLIRFHIGRCHPLKQNRKKQYAMDLVPPTGWCST